MRCLFALVALGPGPDAVLLHQALNAVFAHPDASHQQLTVHARPAIFFLHLSVNRPHGGQKATPNTRAVTAIDCLP